MKKAVKSFTHSVHGLIHAIQTERNLRFFIVGEILVIGLCFILKTDALKMLIILLSGAVCISTELLNTALERLAETLDDTQKKAHQGHYHIGIKLTKDVASAASLIALVMHGVAILLLLLPSIVLLLQ